MPVNESKCTQIINQSNNCKSINIILDRSIKIKNHTHILFFYKEDYTPIRCRFLIITEISVLNSKTDGLPISIDYSQIKFYDSQVAR